MYIVCTLTYSHSNLCIGNFNYNSFSVFLNQVTSILWSYRGKCTVHTTCTCSVQLPYMLIAFHYPSNLVIVYQIQSYIDYICLRLYANV